MARETKGTVIKLVQEDKDLLRELVRETVLHVLETEMTEALGAGKGHLGRGRHRGAAARLALSLLAGGAARRGPTRCGIGCAPSGPRPCPRARRPSRSSPSRRDRACGAA